MWQKILTKIQNWWDDYQKKHPITAERGTVWHKLAWLIHYGARLTSWLPKGELIPPKAKTLGLVLQSQLEAKLEKYRELIKTHMDASGWIMTDECDALLFSSLMSAANEKVGINSAQDLKGYWHRRPLVYEECWKGLGYTGSTISRDMITGLLWHLWFKRDYHTAHFTYLHLKDHNFVMGFGDPSRLILMPGLEATLAEMCARLGGRDYKWARGMMQSWPSSLKGYEIHLLLLHSLLRGEMMGGVDNHLVKVYEAYAKNNPCNPFPLYAYKLYSDGDMNEVAKMLLDERIWPADRLPRRKDRRSDWVTQRACGADWEPGQDDPEREYTGGDFIFLAWLVLK